MIHLLECFTLDEGRDYTVKYFEKELQSKRKKIYICTIIHMDFSKLCAIMYIQTYIFEISITGGNTSELQ